MLALHAAGSPLEALKPVTTGRQILEIQKLVSQVHTDQRIFAYIVELAEATRRHSQIELGVSPRASIALHRAAQALAFCKGRGYVLPDDVQAIFEPVVAHRLLLKREAKVKGLTAEAVLREILSKQPVPGMPEQRPAHEAALAGEALH